MAKISSGAYYLCSSCGEKFTKWYGRCPFCKELGAISDSPSKITLSDLIDASEDGSAFTLNEALIIAQERARIITGIEQLDLVLGGGLVPGSSILISGDPGIGKSTLLIQCAAMLCHTNHNVTYVTAEESVERVADRAKRVGFSLVNNLTLATSVSLEWIVNFILIQSKIDVLILDSIQTISSSIAEGSSGGISQVKYCTSELIAAIKQRGCVLIIVGHVTKDGSVAGPKFIEHMVDVVLSFEADALGSFRMLRASKNRFGSSWEVGIFEMSDIGLRSVSDSAGIFVGDYFDRLRTSGSVAFVCSMGTKAVFLEVQSLAVDSGNFGAPRRSVVGWDVNRMSMILAIISSRLGIDFCRREVYLNIAGGPKVTETAADLAAIMALWSFNENYAFDGRIAVFGEVGLSGEVRPVSNAERRIKEAKKFGFKKIILPKKNYLDFKGCEGISFIPLENVMEIKKESWR